jgi:hypothetical protein
MAEYQLRNAVHAISGTLQHAIPSRFEAAKPQLAGGGMPTPHPDFPTAQVSGVPEKVETRAADLRLKLERHRAEEASKRRAEVADRRRALLAAAYGTHNANAARDAFRELGFCIYQTAGELTERAQCLKEARALARLQPLLRQDLERLESGLDARVLQAAAPTRRPR